MGPSDSECLLSHAYCGSGLLVMSESVFPLGLEAVLTVWGEECDE
jgi:hypothetical protein